jgi:cystathionine beta-lyase
MSKSWLLPEDALRSRRSAKWSRYGADVLPAWVAEMDFTVPSPVRAAIDRIRDADDYGYPLRDGRRADQIMAEAFSNRMKTRFGWKPAEDRTFALADLVQALFACVVAFSDPGDDVVLQMPAYPPFHDAIRDTGRELVAHRVSYGDGRADMNVDGLEALLSERSRIILLCNPQNPTGHVYTRAELMVIADVAIRHDLVVVSDEIHCDLIYSGAHIPFASLGDEIAARTVTLNSATKSFNIPGLRCAVMHFGSAELMQRFTGRIPRKVLGVPNSMGVDATVAAWAEGQPWLDEVVSHLREMRDHVAETIASSMPDLQFHCPDATYLGWIDCSSLRLNQPAFDFFHDRARVAFNAGETFDPERADFVRFNFATSRPLIDEILARMQQALRP